jgi:glycerophosphoryl diester phosphodiesterase
MKKILVEGHRGYASKYPENTLISFEAAMDLGVDAVEFDVWLSQEKIPVIIHDGSCKRTCGVDRHVNSMTVAQIKALSAHYAEKFGDQYATMNVTIPTLEELLKLRQAKRPDLWLGVEIKEYTEECVDVTVALLKEYGVFDMCFFYAFDANVIQYLSTRYNARTMGYPDFQMRNYQPGSDSYYKELGLDLKYVRSEIFPIYQAKKLPIHMYCADNEADVRMCIEKGADLITANNPVPLMRVLGRL